MLVATATIPALVTQPVAAQSISIPTNNTQSAACDTAGRSSAISASCNNLFDNNVNNTGGVLNLGVEQEAQVFQYQLALLNKQTVKLLVHLLASLHPATIMLQTLLQTLQAASKLDHK